MNQENKTKSIGITIHKDIATEIEKRADSIHLLSSEYCHLILKNWLASNSSLKLAEQ